MRPLIYGEDSWPLNVEVDPPKHERPVYGSVDLELAGPEGATRRSVGPRQIRARAAMATRGRLPPRAEALGDSAATATNQQSRRRSGGGWWRARAAVSDSPITSIETAANSPDRGWRRSASLLVPI
jgi:hypothetical protein